MGVPGLFAWVRKRWPKAVEGLSSEVVHSPVDNLYLDLNGLIHPSVAVGAVGPQFDYAAFETSFFAMMEEIIATAAPRKLVYLAVDGIAPRAKLAQQRQRRFRAAAERKALAEEGARLKDLLREQGASVPTDVSCGFDTNAITPRTAFMRKVAESLRRFASNQVEKNPERSVILSDDAVPGEGEHKAIEFIRAQRTQPDHDPSTHHCLVGADADLILLGLGTHELEVSILRSTEKKDKKNGQWIRLSIVREYLDCEFCELRGSISMEFELERLINDFILACTLVGNDFLPHLPSLNIHDGAIDLLLQIYKEQIRQCPDYMVTLTGEVNMPCFSRLLSRLASIESQLFVHQYLQSTKYNPKGSQASKSSRPICFEYQEKGSCSRDRCRFQHLKSKSNDIREQEAALDDPSFIESQMQYFAANSSLVGMAYRRASPAVHQAAIKFGLQFVDADAQVVDDAGVATVVWKPAQVQQLLSEVSVDRVIPIVRFPLNGTDLGAQEIAMPSAEDPSNSSAISLLHRCVKLHFQQKLESVMSCKEREEFEKWNDRFPTAQSMFKFGTDGFQSKYYTCRATGDEGLEHQELPSRMADEYITGLRWVLQYYLIGCPSQSWCYHYHFPPLAEDIAASALQHQPREFIKGHPVAPLAQLLSVLPRESACLLPDCVQSLALSTESPLAYNYPEQLEYDPNGRDVSWQWTVRVPFVVQDDIHSAIDHIATAASEQGDQFLLEMCTTPSAAPELSIACQQQLAVDSRESLSIGHSREVKMRRAREEHIMSGGTVPRLVSEGSFEARLRVYDLSGLCSSIQKSERVETLSYNLPRSLGDDFMIAARCPGAVWPPAHIRCNTDTWQRSYRKFPISLALNDIAQLSTTEMLAAAILEQLKYYFSNKNLSRDKFLTEMMDPEGFVQVSELLTFPRLAQLAQDTVSVINAVEGSAFFELSEDKLRRNPAAIDAGHHRGCPSGFKGPQE